MARLTGHTWGIAHTDTEVPCGIKACGNSVCGHACVCTCIVYACVRVCTECMHVHVYAPVCVCMQQRDAALACVHACVFVHALHVCPL